MKTFSEYCKETYTVSPITEEELNEGLLKKLASLFFPSVVNAWMKASEKAGEWDKLNDAELKAKLEKSNVVNASLLAHQIFGKKADVFDNMWQNTIEYNGKKGTKAAIKYWDSEEGQNKLTEIMAVADELERAVTQTKQYEDKVSKIKGDLAIKKAYEAAINDRNEYITALKKYAQDNMLSTKKLSGQKPEANKLPTIEQYLEKLGTKELSDIDKAALQNTHEQDYESAVEELKTIEAQISKAKQTAPKAKVVSLQKRAKELNNLIRTLKQNQSEE